MPLHLRFVLLGRLEPLLRELYPSVSDITRWIPVLHWSFPTTDRQALSLLWHALRRPAAPPTLPDELWLRVFSFVQRGWWTARELYPDGRPLANVLTINILDGRGAQ